MESFGKYQGDVEALRFRPCCGVIVVFKCEHPAVNRVIESTLCRRCANLKDCTGFEVAPIRPPVAKPVPKQP